ncbi:MAG TPA: TetR/AcrR family transcriptional regulator [Aggregatilineales bacterium]|nr:TetR/AcrR family transcriptional regulator [Aggregatilineales bacterium]
MQQRKQQILDAALRSFAELGYEGTTISDIQRASGASVGSIYHHFEGKEAIATALYVELLQQYRAGLLSAAEQADSAEALIKSLVRFHVTQAIHNDIGARYLVVMRHHEIIKQASSKIDEFNVSLFKEIFAYIKGYVKSGDLRQLPLELYFPVIFGPAQEVLRSYFMGYTQTSLEELIEELAQAAYRVMQP